MSLAMPFSRARIGKPRVVRFDTDNGKSGLASRQIEICQHQAQTQIIIQAGWWSRFPSGQIPVERVRRALVINWSDRRQPADAGSVQRPLDVDMNRLRQSRHSPDRCPSLVQFTGRTGPQDRRPFFNRHTRVGRIFEFTGSSAVVLDVDGLGSMTTTCANDDRQSGRMLVYQLLSRLKRMLEYQIAGLPLRRRLRWAKPVGKRPPALRPPGQEFQFCHDRLP